MTVLYLYLYSISRISYHIIQYLVSRISYLNFIFIFIFCGSYQFKLQLQFVAECHVGCCTLHVALKRLQTRQLTKDRYSVKACKMPARLLRSFSKKYTF